MMKKRPRVAFLLQDFSIGGVQTCVYNVAAQLQDDFEFHFIATHVPVISARFNALGQAVHLPRWREVIRYLRNHHFDLAQVHNRREYTQCALAGGVPVIVERVAGNRSAENPKDGVDWVVASNRGTISLIERTIDPRRITLIYNGVDLQRLCSARPNRLGLAPDDVIVGRVSRIGRGQNLQLLIRAVAELRRRYPHVRLVIVGDRTRREGYEDIWPELRGLAEPLGRSVVFTGEVDEPFELMAGFDIATCVSNHEGIPNSLIEPMAMGKPVVSTDVGQVAELVEEGVSGLLVPCDETSALVRALERLIVDRDLRTRLGQAAQRKVATEFNIEVQARRYGDLYRALLENPPAYAPDGAPARLPESEKRRAFARATRGAVQDPDRQPRLGDILPAAMRRIPARAAAALAAGWTSRLMAKVAGRSPRITLRYDDR